MIKIDKPAQAPDVLRVQGARRRRTHCASFDKRETEYRAGSLHFRFDAALYAHATVKAALIDAQHGKCCFCEAKIRAEGDIEHFRPKAGCCQSSNGPMLQPGYYWLAYEWDNLLWCCKTCNQNYKKSLFPLQDENVRATCHNDAVDREASLIIDPAKIDPEKYISFRENVAFPIDDNTMGQTTIDTVGLNRISLWEARRDYLKLLAAFKDILKSEDRLIETSDGKATLSYAKHFLECAVKDDAMFAGMARAAQAKDFRL